MFFWKTIVAYLPVEYRPDKKSDCFIFKHFIRNRACKTKLDIFGEFHNYIEFCVPSLKYVAMAGVLLSTRGSSRNQFCFLAASNVANLLEVEDLMSVKRGHQTFCPCHLCLIKREHLSGGKKSRLQNLLEALNSINCLRCRNSRMEAEKELQMYFNHTLFLVLSTFSFVKSYPSVELYAIFRVKQTHTLSPRISKMKVECLVGLVWVPDGASSAAATVGSHKMHFWKSETKTCFFKTFF